MDATCIREQIWADRVRLRQKLKLDKGKYQKIWEDEECRQRFLNWCWKPETICNYRRWFQLSRTEIMELIHQRYNIHSAFGVVLCTVVEQIAGFHLTGYPLDGRGTYEKEFERMLTYDRRGGFTMPIFPLAADSSDASNVDKVLLKAWLDHMEHSVGSPGKQLLVRKEEPNMDGTTCTNETTTNNSVKDDEGDPDESGQQPSKAQTSFASDRRIVRLLIARIWAEQLESKFRERDV